MIVNCNIEKEPLNDTQYETLNENPTLLMIIPINADGIFKYGDVEESLSNLNNTKADDIHPFVCFDGSNSNPVNNLYWLDNPKKVEIEKLSKDSEIKLIDNFSMEVKNNKESNVSIDMNNKEVIINSENDKFNIKYEKSTHNEVLKIFNCPVLKYEVSRDFSMNGITTEQMSIRNIDYNTWIISGVKSFSISYKTKLQKDDGSSKTKNKCKAEIKKANVNSVYKIKVNDKKIIIQEDKNHNDIFKNTKSSENKYFAFLNNFVEK